MDITVSAIVAITQEVRLSMDGLGECMESTTGLALLSIERTSRVSYGRRRAEGLRFQALLHCAKMRGGACRRYFLPVWPRTTKLTK
ncbi:MAG TPA: hypothetical protein VNQ56_07585 [Pseudolabrys sp.]|nr:hypothetical protein [Pseudolabrys sp.]